MPHVGVMIEIRVGQNYKGSFKNFIELASMVD
jgi:hypothetical protein